MAIEEQGQGQEAAESNFGEANSTLTALEGMSGVSQETRDSLAAMQTARETGAPMPGSEGMENPNPPEAEAEAGAEAPAAEAPAAEAGAEAGAEAPEGEAGATLEDAFTVESPLMGGEKKIGEANEQASLEGQNFENLDSLNTYLKETHSIDSVSDLTGKIENWKQQEESIDKLTSDAGNVKSLFENMHPDLYAAVVANADGKEWREGINSNVLDYTKAATDFADQELVEKLSPGTLTQEDWEEFRDEDGDEVVKRLVSSTIENAKSKFGTNKFQFDQAAESSVRSAQANQASFDSSVVEAKASMLTEYKDVDSSYVNELESTFTEKGIASVFYNENGTLKADAFQRLAMAKDGAGLIDQYRKIAERRIETKTNQEILLRGADAPTVTKGSSASKGKEEISKEVQDALAAIKGIGGARTY